MKPLSVIICVIGVLLSSTVSGFDGLRKGFVLGGGLGFAPVAKWEVNERIPFFGDVSVDESKAGLGLNFVIGYAWDEYNMIVYEGNVVAYTSDIITFLGSKQTLAQGFNGAAWYHYFGPQGKSFYTTVGLGFYVFDAEDYDQNDPGGALLAGGGYEFARHVQVGGYLSAGKTSDYGVDFKHMHINILISAVAF